MKEKDTGGPAFPGQPKRIGTDIQAQSGVFSSYPGMTLRDYFAAKAMQSMCLTVKREQDVAIIPEAAYRMADSMLKARAA